MIAKWRSILSDPVESKARLRFIRASKKLSDKKSQVCGSS